MLSLLPGISGIKFLVPLLRGADAQASAEMFGGRSVPAGLGKYFFKSFHGPIEYDRFTVHGHPPESHHHGSTETGLTITIDPWFVVKMEELDMEWAHRFFAVLAFRQTSDDTLLLGVVHNYLGRSWYVIRGSDGSYTAFWFITEETRRQILVGSLDEVVGTIEQQLNVDSSIADKLIAHLTDLKPTS